MSGRGRSPSLCPGERGSVSAGRGVGFLPQIRDPTSLWGELERRSWRCRGTGSVAVS